MAPFAGKSQSTPDLGRHLPPTPKKPSSFKKVFASPIKLMTYIAINRQNKLHTKLKMEEDARAALQAELDAAVAKEMDGRTCIPDVHADLTTADGSDDSGSHHSDGHHQCGSGTSKKPIVSADPTAMWQCCQCGEVNDIYLYKNDHPIGWLACDCPHKPCGNCGLSGQVKPFLPIEEPAIIPCREIGDAGTPIADSEKAIPFGIVCSGCGHSWRAREEGTRFSKNVRKMPSLTLDKATRLAPAEGKLRRTRSSLVLGNKRIATPPGMEMPKQAEFVAVRFSGLTCSCDHPINLGTSLCFQIVQKDPICEHIKGFEELLKVKDYEAGWTTTEELEEKGHGSSTLKFGNVEHPNPLRSAPVIGPTERKSWEETCDRNGWD